LTTNEDDDELLLQQVTDQIILVRDEEAHNVANLAAAHAADFMQPVVNPLAVICTAAAGRSVLDQLNRNHLVTPGAAAAAYNSHSPYIQFMTQMHPAAASMMQQMQNPMMISSAATVQSSGEDSVEDHESDEGLLLVRPQSHQGHQQQQLMNYVPQQRRPYEAVLPATDAAETTTASDQLQEEEEDEPSVQQQRNNMLQSGSTTRTTGPFRIHQALQDELNHQFHREQAAAAAAADDPAAADPQFEAAAGRQLLGVRSVFEDAEASGATSSREFNSTTIWQQDDQAGVHLLQRLPPHVTAAGPRVLRRRSRANRAHLLHINSVAAASPLLRSDLNNMGTATRTTPSSNSTITLGLLAAGAAAADPSLLEIEARQVLREQHEQQEQVDQKSTTAAAAGSTTFCMSSMIGSACSTQETTLTSCCNNNNNSIGENFECNICFQKANEAVVTCCGHLFCWPCLYSWLHVHSFHKECPVCKGVIAETAITPIYGRDHGHSTTSSSCNPQQQQQHQQQQSANNSGAAAAGSTHAQTAGAAATVDDVDATTTTTTTTTRSSHESPRIPPRPQARRVESARQQRGRDERERERERERAAATLIRETEAAAAAARSSLQALSLQTQLPATTAADHEIADEYAQAAADQLLNNSFTDPDDQELYNSVLDHHHQHHHHLAPDRYAPVDSSSSSLQVIRAWTASNSQAAGAPPPSAAAAADQMIITATTAGAHDELIINNNTRLMRLDHENRLMTAVAEDLDHDDDVDDLLQQQLHTRSMLQLLPGYIADHVDDMGVVIDHALQEV
jgi:hypothetical protein